MGDRQLGEKILACVSCSKPQFVAGGVERVWCVACSRVPPPAQPEDDPWVQRRRSSGTIRYRQHTVHAFSTTERYGVRTFCGRRVDDQPHWDQPQTGGVNRSAQARVTCGNCQATFRFGYKMERMLAVVADHVSRAL